MAVTLFGAERIFETTVQSGKIVDWTFHEVSTDLVIYSDDMSIFLFDLVERKLHKIVGMLYVCDQICSIWGDSSKKVVRVRIAEDVGVWVESVPESVQACLLELSSQHFPTWARVRKFFKNSAPVS